MQKEDGVRAGLVTEVPFEVRFSIGNVISVSGFVLLAYSLGSFLLKNGQSDLVQTLGFVYAIPALVGGLALKYAELPPVPLTQPGSSAAEMEALRESKGTKIQKKILSDATRFTYGDAHMEEPLRALKLAPKGQGVPVLQSLSESRTPAGGYALSMVFYAPNTPYRVWKDRMAGPDGGRIARFFGDGKKSLRAWARLVSVKERTVELTIATLEEGEEDTALELLKDGSFAPILTAAAEEEAAEAAAKAAASP